MATAASLCHTHTCPVPASSLLFPDAHGTTRGRPGRAARVAVAGVPRRRHRAARGRCGTDPAGPAADDVRAGADPGRPLPHPGGHDRRAARGAAGGATRTHRGLPRARPMHCTSGTTGTPKGVWSGPAVRRRRRRARGRGAVALGLRRQRREPRALAALPLGTAAVRHGHGAGGRPGRRARPVRPGAGHGGDRAGAADVHVLRADAPAAAVRALGRGRHAGPVVVPARRARRCAVPGRGEAAAGRDVPRGVDLGVLRLHRGPVHRLPLRGVARAARDGRPGPARPGAVHRRRRHDLVRGAAVRAVLLLRRPRQDGRRLARHPGRAGVHGRRPRPARRRRLPVPRRAAARTW